MVIGRPLASESGLILINKPRGITSFGVVSRLRKLTGIRRIGHTGTLDPFADGLLPVCLGRATVAVQFMDGYDKTYRLEIEFGRATDTHDLTGLTISEHQLTQTEQQELIHSDFAVLRDAVGNLPGEHLQTPPMYSAVKIDGRKLYEYARKGQSIERKARQIKIYSADLEDVSLTDGILRASIQIECSKGTYIRTIADDLGRHLGFGAHARSLTRLRCGPFSLEQAFDLADLENRRNNFPDQMSFVSHLNNQGLLLPVEKAFTDFPDITLPETAAIRLIKGQSLRPGETGLPQTDWPPVGVRTVIYSRGSLIAVGCLLPAADGDLQFKTERVLIDLADFQQS
ncbi:MAG TPA: tRNA pseudouridine(55) synthase TruB [Clostridiales bacterium]|nr:tRNA pseudouridine(55) synthase TruB [Clostridiales bacterium]